MPVAPDTEQDMPTGLFRRGARYYLRRVVPKELQSVLKRDVIVKSLGVSMLTEAKRLHPHVWLEIERVFDAARAGAPQAVEASQDEDPGAPPETPLEDISPTRISVAEVDRLRRMRDLAATRGTLRDFTTWAKETLRLVQAMLDGESAPSHPIAELEGKRNALRSVLTGEGAHYIAAARKAREEVDQDRRSQAGPNLTAIVARWVAEAKPILRTQKRVPAIVQEFEGIVGERAAAQYGRSDVLAYKDHLLRIGNTPGNINVKLTFLSIPFSYGVRNDLVGSNPVTGIRVADSRKAKEKRRAFSDDEVSRLFAGPVHQRGTRPVAGAGEAAYWLPLLALYTGGRLTELGQLHPDDVTEESYTLATGEDRTAWVIRIVENAERGQRVKTEGSERRVPVHRDLQELGFIRFCVAAKKAKQERLFPDIREPINADLMAPWSKWFGRYRRSLGVMGKDTPFHSFRHTFKHNARLVGIKTEVHNAITGHETGDVADSYGGLSFPLAPLVEGMAAYRVPGLILPPPPPTLGQGI